MPVKDRVLFAMPDIINDAAIVIVEFHEFASTLIALLHDDAGAIRRRINGLHFLI